MINPEDEIINALEGEVMFDNNLLELKDILLSSSVISLWLEEPHLVGDNIIRFSGIIPGGFAPVLIKNANIFDAIFVVKDKGIAEFEFQNYKVFLNTPKANEAVVETVPLSFDLKELSLKEKGKKVILDFYPPEKFRIYLVKNPQLFDNRYSIVFATQDKGSGIDCYEVKERFLGIFGKWKKAKSPYLLSHQSLFSIIEVKAVDKLGLERVERFIPKRMIYLIIIILSSLLFLIFKFLFKFILWRGKK